MIDFMIFTDCGCPECEIPANVHLRHLTFGDYKAIVNHSLQKYGGYFNSESTYKLTDLKPFLGLIHESELKDYAWWGFGDLDLVYGDMSMLVNEHNLTKYDLVTTHNYHIAGHCTFMRNTDYFRKLCLQITDWPLRLNDERHYGFDEADWSSLVYPAIKYPLAFYSRVLRHISPKLFNPFMNLANRVLNRRMIFKEYNTSPAPAPNGVWIFNVREGRVLAPDGKNLPYLHFLFFKKTPWLKTDHYWRSGYYKLGHNIAEYDNVMMDVQSIRGERNG